jgi:transposase-like protein
VDLEVRASFRPRIASSTPTADVAMASRRDGHDDCGSAVWLWRGVDGESEVLDLLVQRRRDKAAAAKAMRKLLKKRGFAPDVRGTDKLRAYGPAKSEIGLLARHEQGLRKNNRAENSHQPTRRRERKMQRFKSPGSASGSSPFTPPSTTRSTSSGHRQFKRTRGRRKPIFLRGEVRPSRRSWRSRAKS